MAFNSGVARGSNRVSIFRLSRAQTRAALCWLARSSKTTRFQPRQGPRIVWRNASCASWVQSSVISNARSPLRRLIAPWSTRLACSPLIGTRTGSPMGPEQFYSGGVSVTIVSSSIKMTVRARSFRPRFSPLLLAARSPAVPPTHAGAVSRGDPGVRSPR